MWIYSRINYKPESEYSNHSIALRTPPDHVVSLLVTRSVTMCSRGIWEILGAAMASLTGGWKVSWMVRGGPWFLLGALWGSWGVPGHHWESAWDPLGDLGGPWAPGSSWKVPGGPWEVPGDSSESLGVTIGSCRTS